jgi:flagellar hook-associated protein 2
VQAVGGNAAATLFAGTPVETAGQNAAGSIGGLEATGAGQELRSGDGLRLRVTGGAPGARGSVDFSRGLASQLALLAKAQLDGTAMLKSRTDSLDASVKSLGTEREAVTRRLEGVEKRLRAQFIALDAMVTRMRSTSDFLGRQLSSLG